MMRIKNVLFIPAVLIILLIFCPVPVVKAYETDPEPLPVNHNNLSFYSQIRRSYLFPTDEGYERVYCNDGKVRTESYDKEFNKLGGKTFPLELEYWGGVFCGRDFYYIFEGQRNTDEKDDAEVIRVIKYDRSWNRIGAASITGNLSLFGGDVRYPFDLGCNQAVEKDGILYMVTGHESYVDPNYNQGHQGLLMIAVDEETMTGSVVKCDNWHSFAQYIEVSGDYLYLLEQSEGSRGTILKRIETSSGKYRTNSIPVFEYGGSRTSAWAIACRATVDDMDISSENILGIGVSIDQSQYDNYHSGMPYNIYLTVTPISSFSKESTTVKWLTDYTQDGELVDIANLVKINDNRFAVFWSESEEEGSAQTDDLLSGYKLHYLFIDGAGNKISEEYTANAPFSDCHPFLDGGKIVFYASNGAMVNFYTIDAFSGEFNKKIYRTLGGYTTWNISDKVLTVSGKGAVNTSGNAAFKPVADYIEHIVIENGVTSVSEEAFANLTSLVDVQIAKSVKSIGKRAFAYSQTLRDVYIRGMNTAIGENAFHTGYYWIGSGKPVVYARIHCYEGSKAEKYAKENNILYSLFVMPQGIEINTDEKTMEKGESFVLEATVSPEEAEDKTVTWKSSNKKVATVSSGGKVKAVGAGTAEITATTVNGLCKTCTVTVIVTPASVKLNQAEATVYFGEPYTLTATVLPEDSTDKTVTWTIDNTSIASVEDGVVTGWAAGKATVTVQTVNGHTDTCDITVLSDGNESNPFADIKSGGWEYEAALYAYNNGYMVGNGELVPGRVLFAPNSKITRAQFVQILYSVEGKPEVTYRPVFNDVPEGKWYTNAVMWAQENGVVAGKGDIFDINGPATREQLALMFYKYAAFRNYDTGIPSGGRNISDFPDGNKVSGWAAESMNWALSKGILAGKGNGNLGPKDTATRIQCAAMLRTFMNSFTEEKTLEFVSDPVELPVIPEDEDVSDGGEKIDEEISDSDEIKEDEEISDGDEIREDEEISDSDEIKEAEENSDGDEIREDEEISDGDEIREDEEISGRDEIRED